MAGRRSSTQVDALPRSANSHFCLILQCERSTIMRKVICLALLGALACGATIVAQQPGAPLELKDTKQRYSYAMGFEMARHYKDLVDIETMIRGIRDGLAGKGALSEEELRA